MCVGPSTSPVCVHGVLCRPPLTQGVIPGGEHLRRGTAHLVAVQSAAISCFDTCTTQWTRSWQAFCTQRHKAAYLPRGSWRQGSDPWGGGDPGLSLCCCRLPRGVSRFRCAVPLLTSLQISGFLSRGDGCAGAQSQAANTVIKFSMQKRTHTCHTAAPWTCEEIVHQTVTHRVSDSMSESLN
jgi:hypothetical protein